MPKCIYFICHQRFHFMHCLLVNNVSQHTLSLLLLILILSQDIVISAVFAFLFFCIAISTAVYGGRFGDWEREYNSLNFQVDIPDGSAELNEDMGGVSVSWIM